MVIEVHWRLPKFTDLGVNIGIYLKVFIPRYWINTQSVLFFYRGNYMNTYIKPIQPTIVKDIQIIMDILFKAK